MATASCDAASGSAAAAATVDSSVALLGNSVGDTSPRTLGLSGQSEHALGMTTDAVEALLSWYRPWCQQVGTISLPHHGSSHNICDRLFDGEEWSGLTLYFATCRKGARKHPAESVRRALRERGQHLHCVTDEEETSFCEEVRVVR